MIAVIDYGVGNLFSLRRSLVAIGMQAVITRNEEEIKKASHVILPGVGAFADAREKLKSGGMDRLLTEQCAAGKPLLGICLGMQLLFERSLEYGSHPGLGLIEGEVLPMRGLIPDELKVPQIGWNALSFRRNSPLLRGIKEGSYVYFVHSYCAEKCERSVVAVTGYGRDVTAMVQKDNIFGCQFHPEKSGTVGLQILKNFCEVSV